MGLFSKKTIICEKCGKEYQARITFGVHLCDECYNRDLEKQENVKGYVDYAYKMCWDPYTEEQMDQIATHRDQILEKYRQTQGISRAELMNASDNYKNLTDQQAFDVLTKIARSSVASTTGAAYSGSFFALTQYEKTIVDAEDVFAVGYTNVIDFESTDNEVILCAVFTNDPYIPVFPLIYLGKLGFFELIKSKKGRRGVEALFETMCPNLTYSVQDLKKLKKQIKAEGSVNGRIEMKAIIDMIDSAEVASGIFNTKKMNSELKQSSADMLDAYGYIQEDEINQILKIDKLFNRKYWMKRLEQLAAINYEQKVF